MFYMDNLRGELRDSIPVRPIYVMEEKKCHDIIYALLDVNYEKRSRKDFFCYGVGECPPLYFGDEMHTIIH